MLLPLLLNAEGMLGTVTPEILIDDDAVKRLRKLADKRRDAEDKEKREFDQQIEQSLRKALNKINGIEEAQETIKPFIKSREKRKVPQAGPKPDQINWGRLLKDISATYTLIDQIEQRIRTDQHNRLMAEYEEEAIEFLLLNQ